MNAIQNDDNLSLENEWPVKPYYKRVLAQAYAPDISPVAALNRLALWIKLNEPLRKALLEHGYTITRQVVTPRQGALIFRYLGRP